MTRKGITTRRALHAAGSSCNVRVQQCLNSARLEACPDYCVQPYSLAMLEERLKTMYKSVTEGKFSEALRQVNVLLALIPLTIVDTRREVDELKELISIARCAAVPHLAHCIWQWTEIYMEQLCAPLVTYRVNGYLPACMSFFPYWLMAHRAITCDEPPRHTSSPQPAFCAWASGVLLLLIQSITGFLQRN